MDDLINRQDVKNLILNQSIKNFKKLDNSKLTEFKESSIKLQETLSNIDISDEKDRNYIRIYIKSLITDEDINIPARGINCTHFECENFDVYMPKVFEYK
jgi:hypothetical protein